MRVSQVIIALSMLPLSMQVDAQSFGRPAGIRRVERTQQPLAAAAQASVPAPAMAANGAQPLANAHGTYSSPGASPVVRGNAACDEARRTTIEDKQKLGGRLEWVGFALSIAGIPFASQMGTRMVFVLGGGGVGLYGHYLKAWDPAAVTYFNSSLDGLAVARTTSNDVLRCLGQPSSRTTAGGADRSEVWNYLKGSGSQITSAQLTFRRDTLTNIRKSDARMP